MIRPSSFCFVVLHALAFGSLLGACASKPETKHETAPFVAQHPSVTKNAPNDSTNTVNVSDDIVHACGIKDADSYFAYDSAKLDTKDIHVIADLAKCFTSGPLKDQKMKLVGRSDPRGSEEYNTTLGQHRADSVMKALADKGLSKDKMDSTSRGEMDAVGTDEPSWAHDRRVDVLLDK